jgi:DNA-binding transcriptional LysR family regulator
MELRHLRYFIAVAEEGHITRAAERLGIQQPPLSQQIKAIERELDVQLFRRKPRGVELTDAGRAFLPDALATLARLDRGIETTRRTARGEQGRICLGVTQTSPFHPFVPRVIRAFREAFPLVSVTLEEENSNELVEHLRNERIDAAFIRTPPADAKGLVVSTLLEEELFAALPAGHVLAQSDGRGDAALPLKALAGETFVVWGRPQGMGAYPTVIAACHAAGFNPRLAHEGLRLASTLNLVAIGLGISIVPASMQCMQMEGLAYRRLKCPTPLTVPLMLASRRGDPSAVLRHYLNLVKQAAKEFSADGSECEVRRVQKRKIIRSPRAGSPQKARDGD